MPLVLAVLVILPTPQVSVWDGWHQQIDVNHGLTVNLLDTYDVLRDAETTPVTGVGVERWRPLVAKWWPSEQVSDALKVIRCESGGNPDAKNPRSSARGLFQHLGKYWGRRSAKAGWAGASIFDPEANIAVAAWLWRQVGWKAWSCKP